MKMSLTRIWIQVSLIVLGMVGTSLGVGSHEFASGSGRSANLPDAVIAMSDCSCSASTPQNGLATCQTVSGSLGCTSGTCTPAPTFCKITGSVSFSSTCELDRQICIVSTAIVCFGQTGGTINGNNTQISCGSIHTLTVNFCQNPYPLTCGTPSGTWAQTFTCTACLE